MNINKSKISKKYLKVFTNAIDFDSLNISQLRGEKIQKVVLRFVFNYDYELFLSGIKRKDVGKSESRQVPCKYCGGTGKINTSNGNRPSFRICSHCTGGARWESVHVPEWIDVPWSSKEKHNTTNEIFIGYDANKPSDISEVNINDLMDGLLTQSWFNEKVNIPCNISNKTIRFTHIEDITNPANSSEKKINSEAEKFVINKANDRIIIKDHKETDARNTKILENTFKCYVDFFEYYNIQITDGTSNLTFNQSDYKLYDLQVSNNVPKAKYFRRIDLLKKYVKLVMSIPAGFICYYSLPLMREIFTAEDFDGGTDKLFIGVALLILFFVVRWPMYFICSTLLKPFICILNNKNIINNKQKAQRFVDYVLSLEA